MIKSFGRKTTKPLLAAFALLLLPAALLGRFAQSSLLPVDQLLEKTEARIANHPEDENAHYVNGRIHYLAFFNSSQNVPAYRNLGELPSIVPYWSSNGDYLYQSRLQEAKTRTLSDMGRKSEIDLTDAERQDWRAGLNSNLEALVAEEWMPANIGVEQSIEHARKAYDSFETAIALNPQIGLYKLGKASLLEQFDNFAQAIKIEKSPKTFEDVTPKQIRDSYFTAWETGLGETADLEKKPVEGLRGIVSYEAGQAYLRLTENMDDLSAEESDKVERIKNSLSKLENLKRGPITPIVFSLKPGATLDSALDAKSMVSFDLDGDGQQEQWPWVSPTTGFLVWDPAGSGVIQSGRQLFGSYTFQIPWENGYEPLTMLDSDSSGDLTGLELTGIRVWFDRNSNAISETGEVIELSSIGITSIGLNYEIEYDVPYCENGLSMRSGLNLPTWDWIVEYSD